jgi:universal stress protein A
MKMKLTVAQKVAPATHVEAAPSSATNGHAVRSALNLRRIMVPIDFSSCSKKALQYAISLAQDYHATVDLIHFVEGKLANNQLIRNCEKALQALAREESRGRVPTAIFIRIGQPLPEIINVAKTGFVDLLVISTHARASLPDFCLGSIAEDIVRYAPCPVLVVRDVEHDCLSEGRLSRDRKRRVQ